MPASDDSPSVGNHAANFASPPPNKIALAIGKERRVPSRRLGTLSSGEAMKKESNGQHNNGNGAESVRIWKARNYIHQHCAEELSLGQVARAANTSTNYFSEKFKEATGTNFVKYVARTRFEKAEMLLRNADLRVSEIAFAVGFQSLSQFNRVFKKLAGKSPTDYRVAVRHKNGSG
jgi:AraC-like DNA-binding protein